MNDKQVDNWRGLFGSHLSKDEVVGMRDPLQNGADKLNEEIKKRNNCDGECSKCKKEDECIL